MAETARSTHNNLPPEESAKVEGMNEMEIQLKHEDIDISDCKCDVKQGVAISHLDGTPEIPTSLLASKEILMAETARSTQNFLLPEESVKVEGMNVMEIQLKHEDIDIFDCKCEVKQEGVAISHLDDAHELPTSLLAFEAKVKSATQPSDTNGCLLEYIKKENKNIDVVDVAIKQDEIDISDCESTLKQEEIDICDSNETCEKYVTCQDHASESHVGTSSAKYLDVTSNLLSDIVRMYHCTVCHYKTKYKWYLKTHEKAHFSLDESTFYQCNSCDFQTKIKKSLRNHSKLHLSLHDVELYKCKMCDFQTRYKSGLTRHLNLHLSLDEVEFYKCGKCDFQTIDKYVLKRHSKRHLGPGETELFKCATCDFQTKFKHNLIQHLKRHLSLDKVKLYKCETCDYQARYKKSVQNHSRRHLRLDEVEFFKCGKCGFQTKYKYYLKTHVMRHLSLDKVSDFQTKYKMKEGRKAFKPTFEAGKSESLLM